MYGHLARQANGFFSRRFVFKSLQNRVLLISWDAIMDKFQEDMHYGQARSVSAEA